MLPAAPSRSARAQPLEAYIFRLRPPSQIWLLVPLCSTLGLGCQESSRDLILPLTFVPLGGAGWAAASSGSQKQESE